MARSKINYIIRFNTVDGRFQILDGFFIPEIRIQKINTKKIKYNNRCIVIDSPTGGEPALLIQKIFV